MFKDSDFDTFQDTSLAGRMAKIKTVIDPTFEELAGDLLPLFPVTEQQWVAHVAKHLRRTVYPPDNTWVAFAPNKRGYKMMPHFELGIWEDNIYFYLAVLENLKEKPVDREYWGTRLEEVRDDVLALPEDFVLSDNHMVNEFVANTPENFDHILDRFKGFKQPEFLVGVTVSRGDVKIASGEIADYLNGIVKKLVPIYEKTDNHLE
jgi:uncharacterized protein YktB (UPF0637 family)